MADVRSGCPLLFPLPPVPIRNGQEDAKGVTCPSERRSFDVKPTYPDESLNLALTICVDASRWVRLNSRYDQRDVILLFATAELLDGCNDLLQKRRDRETVMRRQHVNQPCFAEFLSLVAFCLGNRRCTAPGCRLG